MQSIRGFAFLWLAACGDKTPSDTDSPSGDADTDTDTDADADTDTDTDPTAETVALAGACPLTTSLGGFGVESDALMTVVSGAAGNGVVPLTVLEEVGAAGECVILRRVSLFCDPACAPDETCGFDGECIPYPVQQDLGTVSIEGLLQPVSMAPSPPGFNYYDLTLPHPAYNPGELVTLRTSGAFFPAFALYGVGLVPLVVPEQVWVLDETQDLSITWTAAGGPVRSTVHLRITIDQHGASPVELDCDFPDTGSGVVPAALGAQFVAFGVTGFPTATVTRRTVDSIEVDPGCIDFAVAWSTAGSIDVAGYTPCTDQDDCPTGQICNTSLEICE